MSLSIDGASFSEAGGSAIVTATLSAPSAVQVSVSLGFGGAATLGSDYSASQTVLVIPAGSLSATTTLSAIDDLTFEGDEALSVSISSLDGATPGSPATVSATIVDNDPSPPPMVGARIWQIQGAQHRSPMVGMSVSNVPGIVTARASNGFYLQDPSPDANPARGPPCAGGGGPDAAGGPGRGQRPGARARGAAGAGEAPKADTKPADENVVDAAAV